MLRFLALLILVALVGGGVYLWQANPHRSPQNFGDVKEQLKDSVLSGGVKTAFSLHRRLRQYPIAVSTEQGVVTLAGQLPQDELRAAAERLAAGVPEVNRVVDNITIGGVPLAQKDEADERSLGERLDDEALEVQARMAFSLNKHLKGAKLEVTAWKKTLRLSGEVADPELRKLALDIVREITGVKSVTDSLRTPGDPVRVETASDDRRAAVLRAVRANSNLSGRSIDVRSDGDKVVLVGRVSTGAERDLAGLLARDALGRAVQNDLEIRH